MDAPKAAELLNLVGFLTGATLCAMLLGLVRRGRDTADRSDRLPFFTALLGLAWNLGELGDYLLSRVGYLALESWLSAVSFAALALLAAVVVHSVARDVRRGTLITAVAYGCSIAAIVLHLRTLASGDPRPSATAFSVLTIAFGVIIVPLAIATRSQTNGRRALWILALALFAVSANHLGHFHDDAGGWLAELLGHHAVLPLAFAILYQEYRFALADLFLKRALTLLAVVAIATVCYGALSALPQGSVTVALLIGCWVLTAVFYPALRGTVSKFVDTALLRRQDYGGLRSDLAQAVQSCDAVADVLDRTAAAVATALNAKHVWWADASVPSVTNERVTTHTNVPTTELPAYVLRVGELVGGRRLLSDDRVFLESAALVAARRIDAVRLSIERFDQRLREQEMQRLATEAELRALRAQINPHFLFNTLTTIGYLIESAPPRAMTTLLRLTSLLRSVLRSEGELTTLGREVELVEHYLDIERERFEERLRVRIDVPQALRALTVPCLILQPLVENAIKHGVARAIQGGEVRVEARLETDGARQTLCVAVRNTGAPPLMDLEARSDRVGLNNVERRLAGHYGAVASLTLSWENGVTTAEMRLPLAVALDAPEQTAQRAIG